MARAVEVALAAFEVDNPEPETREWFRARAEHLLATDGEGAFVAEDGGGRIVGVAQAMARDGVWVLSLLVVDPDGQSGGAGGALFERTLAYGQPDAPGLIVSSNDPRALRLYGRAGFSLQPTFEAGGTINRSALPRPDPRIREGSAADLDALQGIAREIRGATYTPELELVLRYGGRLLRFEDRGFAVAHARHGVWLLVARDEEAATELLWNALANRDRSRTPGDPVVDGWAGLGGHRGAIRRASSQRPWRAVRQGQTGTASSVRSERSVRLKARAADARPPADPATGPHGRRRAARGNLRPAARRSPPGER